MSLQDRGELLPVVYNWPADDVDIICVTDGSRILGLGDLGVQGMGISIGKLVLYVAAAGVAVPRISESFLSAVLLIGINMFFYATGINPMKTLPICIDVGTNNKELRDSDLYLGLQQDRCGDMEYFELLDEFMDAVYSRWPNVLVQV